MTVKELKKQLECIPDDVEVVVRKNGLRDVKKLKYQEDYVYGTSFRHVIFEE